MRRILASAITLVLAAACGDPASSSEYQNSSGAVALSRDDALVYVADSDNGTLSVVDADRREKIADVKVGRNPENVLVGVDDTIYVSNRGSRSISVIRKNEWNAPVATVDVGVEPYAMALADEGRTLLVVNSTALDSVETGTLMGIDTGSLQPTFEVEVGDEPRGLTVVDGKALVSLSRTGELVTVDLSTRTVTTAVSNKSLMERANPQSPKTPNAFDVKMSSGTFSPRSMTALTTTPDRSRVFSTVVWSSNAVLDSPTSVDNGFGGGGAAYGGGPCGVGGVASAGTITLDSKSLTASVDPLSSCNFESNADYPAPIMLDRTNGSVQGPRALAVDATGQWLFVANHDSDNVTVMPTFARPARGDGSTVTQTVDVPSMPVGIAIQRDSRRAWVYSLGTHQLVSIEAKNTSAGNPILVRSDPIQVASDVMPIDAVIGRKLFFSAIDTRMNTIGVSCGTCHVDVREDGHVWNFVNGPRQTPSLAGRNLAQTAPYHWNGEFPSFNDFVSHTVSRRMGGFGLQPSSERQLLTFIDFVSAPDNPFKLAQPTEAQVRGAKVFQKAECNSCHLGATLSDVRNVDVGTMVKTGGVVDTDPGLNTPSLLSLARTAPFLHDGSAPNLEARILQGKASDKHGKTSLLTEDEVKDLTAYLNSL